MAIKIYSEVRCNLCMSYEHGKDYDCIVPNSRTNFFDMLIQGQHSTVLACLRTLEIEKVTTNRFSKTIHKEIIMLSACR